MEFDSIRPVLSGLVGGVAAIFICRALARWVPTSCDRKSASILLQENRAAIWIANTLFFGGIVAGIAAYSYGLFASSDWRGLALGVGGGVIACMVAIPLVALLNRGSPREAYVAYAISQKTPVTLLGGILMLLAAPFPFALASVLAGRGW